MAAILDPRPMTVRRSSRIARVHSSPPSSSSTATKHVSSPPKPTITTTAPPPPSRKRSRTPPISPIPIDDPRLTPRALRALKRQRLSLDSALELDVVDPCMSLSQPRSSSAPLVVHRKKRKENIIAGDVLPVRESQPVKPHSKHADSTLRESSPPQPSPLSPKYTFSSSADENILNAHTISLSSETHSSNVSSTSMRPPPILPELASSSYPASDVSSIPPPATQAYVTYTTLSSSASPTSASTSFGHKPSQSISPQPHPASSSSSSSCSPAGSLTQPPAQPHVAFPGHDLELDPVWMDGSDSSKNDSQRQVGVDLLNTNQVQSTERGNGQPDNGVLRDSQSADTDMECESPRLHLDRDTQLQRDREMMQRERDREVNIWKLACQERVDYILRRYGVDTIKAIVASEARSISPDPEAGSSTTPTLGTRFRLYTPTSYTYGSLPDEDDTDPDAEGEADTDCKYEYGVGYSWDCDYKMRSLGDKESGDGIEDDDFDEDYDYDEEFDDEEYEGESDESLGVVDGDNGKPVAEEPGTGDKEGQPRALTQAQNPTTKMDVDLVSTSAAADAATFSHNTSPDFNFSPCPSFGLSTFSQCETTSYQDNGSNSSTTLSTPLLQRISLPIGPGTPPGPSNPVTLSNPYVTPRIPPVPPLSSLHVPILSEPPRAYMGRGTPPDRRRLAEWASAVGRFSMSIGNVSGIESRLSSSSGPNVMSSSSAGANDSMSASYDDIVNPAAGEWTSFLHSLLAPSPSPSPSPPLGSSSGSSLGALDLSKGLGDLDVSALPLSLQLPSSIQIPNPFQLPNFPLSPSFQLPPFHSAGQMMSSDQVSPMFSLSNTLPLSSPALQLSISSAPSLTATSGANSEGMNWFELGLPGGGSSNASSSTRSSNPSGDEPMSSHPPTASTSLPPACLPTPNSMLPSSPITSSSCASASGPAIEDVQRESSTLRFALG
ncbi:hypothetical protein SERLADRAFT_438652 [Serpula lacrymans var. lacrymans S7.9]|uniref:Uncharacterized protein n=1 Tax=Serpula lacrymans var. lacrymans (strain S7.9) TaxID=578457 RepID=F8NWM0_SERL9|nr:uncharacterized protein SERLADRAFT_438652 [Serpula lacrymans var. lacrymans S7.9]EGO25044.1 hypothetical protein SERLADRAFT_438652 [Serpula lacrymans var. lacrymans S7.9]